MDNILNLMLSIWKFGVKGKKRERRGQKVGSVPSVPWFSVENCPGMEKHLLFTFSTVAEPEVRSFLQEKSVPCPVKPFEVADLIAHARRLMQKAQAASA
jgi:hypothetical protein